MKIYKCIDCGKGKFKEDALFINKKPICNECLAYRQNEPKPLTSKQMGQMINLIHRAKDAGQLIIFLPNYQTRDNMMVSVQPDNHNDEDNVSLNMNGNALQLNLDGLKTPLKIWRKK